MSIPVSVTSPRLTLRRFKEDDAPALYAAATETADGLRQWYGGGLAKAGLTVDDVIAFIRGCAQDFEARTFLQYGVFTADGTLVGTGCFHHLDWPVPKGRIGYWVRQSAQGHGYATEIAHILTRMAFEKLGFERLEIRSDINNPASGGVARRLGYEFLTVFKKNKRSPGGELWDLEIHARLDAAGLPDMAVTYRDA